MSDDVEQRVLTLLVEQVHLDLAAEGIDTGGSLVEDLGLDSVAILTLVSALEDEFGVELEDDEVTRERFASVASVVALIRSKA
ncbi:MAG: acyl carrier protein [Acidimicrobiia bacterium]|jgi:acyl carrier protein|nr:acyl carrier protein [Acidimicrobiia bacterium]